jgi:hypothetical protein
VCAAVPPAYADAVRPTPIAATAETVTAAVVLVNVLITCLPIEPDLVSDAADPAPRMLKPA